MTATLKTYTTQITHSASDDAGSSVEIIDLTFEYCGDVTGDGYDDVRVSLALNPASNSETEDIVGVAFDVNTLMNLKIVDILRSTSYGSVTTASPVVVMGENQVSDKGPLDPGFNTSGGNLGEDGEPYDVGIRFGELGSGDGIVQQASFVLTTVGADLDAEQLLDGTSWWARLQSTDGGEDSAKMYLPELDLPPCSDDPSGCAEGLTPGYWKTHGPADLGAAPGGQTNDWDNITGRPVYDYGDGDRVVPALTYEQLIFGNQVDGLKWTLPGGKQPTELGDLSVLGALSIGGGGVNALARHSMAAILNSRDKDVSYFASEEQVRQWTGQALLGSLVTIDGIDYNAETLAQLFSANNELGLDPCALV